MKPVSIIKADYIEEFKVEILFDNEEKRIVDFASFLKEHSHPQYNKYKDKNNFRTFKIENGNIVWGDDWDMIFPVWDLYNGVITA